MAYDTPVQILHLMLDLHVLLRRLEIQIKEALKRSPSVALIGPRLEGKATIIDLQKVLKHAKQLTYHWL